MMKFKHVILPSLAGLLIGQASVQGKTYDYTEDPVIVDGGNYDEDYIDRFTSDMVKDSVKILNGGAYMGNNINITNSYAGDDVDSAYGIIARGGRYINLSADEGIWNSITVIEGENSSYNAGIVLGEMLETSTVSNTQIWMNGDSPNIGQYGILVHTSSKLVLDNVEIHVAEGQTSVGLFVRNDGVITNEGKKGVSVTVDLSSFGTSVLAASNGGTIDLHDSTLIAVGGNAYSSVLSGNKTEAANANTISLTDSRISSDNGNTIIGDVSGQLNVTLDNVNLTKAKDQHIMVDANIGGNMYAAILNLTLSNGTALDGYASATNSSYYIAESNIDISSGASWNVTRNSVLGDLSLGLGSLSLDRSSMLSFEELSEGTFTNITSAAIALEAGAILMLGADAATIEGWIEGNGGTYSTQLFVTETVFSNEGVILMSSDGLAFEYTTDNLGTYVLTRVLPPSIPEPSTGALCLATVGLLAFRRKQATAVSLFGQTRGLPRRGKARGGEPHQ